MANLSVQSLLAVYYVLWVCVPMIPAVFIYGLFPKNPIGVTGPLGALTVNATGAFAAYIIVFGLAFPIVRQSENALGGMMSPVWTVSAKVVLLDEDGHPVNPEWLKSLGVELHPDFYTTANDIIKISVPEVNNSLPNIVFRVPNFGSQAMDLGDDPTVTKDEFRKTIKVSKPIEIKRAPVISTGVASAATSPQ